nr:DNA adenine methylase [Treponema sp.]
MDENPEFLTQQLITYIGNKRTLLPFIGQAVAIVKKDLNKSKISCADVFSGSGIVARYLKQFSSRLVVNDLENYSCLINRCYLSNFASMPKTKQEELKQLHASILQKIDRRMKKLE